MAYEFRTKRRVEFAETDMAGIIHFTSLFRYMEETEHAFFRSLGLSIVTRHKGQKIGWPRVATSCEFFRPVVFEDEVDIHLCVSRKGKSSLTYSFAFYKDDTFIARGQSTSVCCAQGGPRSLRRIPIPPFISKKIEAAPFAGDPAPRPGPRRKQTKRLMQPGRKNSK